MPIRLTTAPMILRRDSISMAGAPFDEREPILRPCKPRPLLFASVRLHLSSSLRFTGLSGSASGSLLSEHAVWQTQGPGGEVWHRCRHGPKGALVQRCVAFFAHPFGAGEPKRYPPNAASSHCLLTMKPHAARRRQRNAQIGGKRSRYFSCWARCLAWIRSSDQTRTVPSRVAITRCLPSGVSSSLCTVPAGITMIPLLLGVGTQKANCSWPVFELHDLTWVS